jgi:hypothetical protein
LTFNDSASSFFRTNRTTTRAANVPWIQTPTDEFKTIGPSRKIIHIAEVKFFDPRRAFQPKSYILSCRLLPDLSRRVRDHQNSRPAMCVIFPATLVVGPVGHSGTETHSREFDKYRTYFHSRASHAMLYFILRHG